MVETRPKPFRITYGFGIDLDRFLRSLTTYAKEDGSLRLAIKQKGAASAEAFAHARYQLYQSMYWHHTFRATKAMLLEAVDRVSREIDSLNEDRMFDRHPLRTTYIREVLGARDYSPSGSGSRKKSRSEKSSQRTGRIETRLRSPPPELPIRYRDDEFLIFLIKLTEDQKARALLSDLIGRNYYKRILEISPAKLGRGAWEKFRDRFKKNRTAVQEAVEAKLLDALRANIQSVGKARESLKVNDELARVNTLASTKSVFLVDVPLRGWFAASEAPIYVSDYKRRHFRAGSAHRGFETREEFWDKLLSESMKAAAYIRVYCEPEVHSVMLSVMPPDSIYKAVLSAIPELRI
jgi:HD superfamily phosphohydrolase